MVLGGHLYQISSLGRLRCPPVKCSFEPILSHHEHGWSRRMLLCRNAACRPLSTTLISLDALQPCQYHLLHVVGRKGYPFLLGTTTLLSRGACLFLISNFWIAVAIASRNIEVIIRIITKTTALRTRWPQPWQESLLSRLEQSCPVHFQLSVLPRNRFWARQHHSP